MKFNLTWKDSMKLEKWIEVGKFKRSSFKLNAPKDKTWTVERDKTGDFWSMKVDGLTD